MSQEPRIFSSYEQEKKNKEHWDSIEGMEAKKREVLERCRREAKARKGR